MFRVVDKTASHVLSGSERGFEQPPKGLLTFDIFANPVGGYRINVRSDRSLLGTYGGVYFHCPTTTVQCMALTNKVSDPCCRPYKV